MKKITVLMSCILIIYGNFSFFVFANSWQNESELLDELTYEEETPSWSEENKAFWQEHQEDLNLDEISWSWSIATENLLPENTGANLESGEIVNENTDLEILTWDTTLSPNSNESWTVDNIVDTEIIATTWENLPQISITEVFAFWTNERIKITNHWEDFSGSLQLSWVKTTLWTSEDIFLWSHQSLIFADSEVKNLTNDLTILFNTSKTNFSLSDSKESQIFLLFSGWILDDFSLSQELLKHKKETTFSFQKQDNGTITYQESLHIKKENSEGGQEEEPEPWINTGTTENFSNESAHLILSEVFYDDCEDEDYCDVIVKNGEWIEIFNIGTGNFYGDLTLSWNIFHTQTSDTYPWIHIPAGSFIIFANDPSLILLSGGVIPLEDPHQLFINDTDAIKIDLLSSWTIIDRFYADGAWVKKRNDYLTSFHKILQGEQSIITRAMSNEPENSKKYLTANPWTFYTYAENLTDYTLKDSTDIQDPEPQNGTWTQPTEPEEPKPNEVCWEDLIAFSEIFRGWERYEPYIEFSILQDIHQLSKLYLSGSLLKKSIEINLQQETDLYEYNDLQKNTKLILTSKEWELTNAGLITFLLHSELELNKFSWELYLYWFDGQSRQLLDSIKVHTWWNEKSIYKQEKIKRCNVAMDKVDDFSPWFSEDALKYFSVTSNYNIKTIETVKYVSGWGGWCSCPSKEELCKTEEKSDNLPWKQDNNESQKTPDQESTPNQNQISYPFSDKTIKIVALQYQNPESITLQSFLPYDIDFSKKQYYLKASTSSTKKYLPWILNANTIDTFSKNFWFADAWACISLYSGENELDQYCYSSEKQDSVKKENQNQTFNPWEYTLKILDIIYDPDGSDTNNEIITIQNNSSKSIDLSSIKMKVNTTNKKLQGELLPWEIKNIQGTFWFPNSTKNNADVVVSLFYEQTIFDTYTYNPNQKAEAESWTVKVYSVLDGDTFRFRKEDGTLQSVRLLGADAPESTKTRYRTTECFGIEAKKYLTELIKGKNVRIEFDETQQQIDLYGRYVAYVYFNDELINEKMIKEWYAKEYTFKNPYQFQQEFKKSEQEARNHQKGLRSSATCGISLEESPEVREQEYDKLWIKITSILYDPEGTDKDKESFSLSVDQSKYSWSNEIDFSDNFSLQIFPRGEFATGSTKTKNLSDLWFYPLQPTMTFTGNFNFPNSKATCVALKYKEYTFDTFCYNPEQENQENEETQDSFIPKIKIVSLIPNPSGKDEDKEEIRLFWSRQPEEPEEIDLKTVYLLINGKTKKKISGTLTPETLIPIKDSFWFPNSASCITLKKWETILDTFCYDKPKEGTIFKENNERIEQIDTEDLSILKKISLVKNNDQLCVVYNKTTFTCKKIPNSTTENEKKLLSFQNNFISELQSYLKQDYSLLFYKSDLKDYFSFYNTMKKEIKKGNYTTNWKGETLNLTDVSNLFSKQYEQSIQEYLVSSLQHMLPWTITHLYEKEKTEYLEKLWKE